jgi:glycopeptide antibiotics resistance protein
MHRIKKLFIKLLPLDKSLHLLGGVLIYLVCQNFLNWWIPLSVVLIVAVGIEVYDKVSKTGTPELMDIVYTVIGGLIAMGLTM